MKHLQVQGISVPKLGFGTWQLEGDECYEGVTEALEIGYRHVDTAQAYENEEHVGRALDDSDVPREEIFLTTKVWRTNFEHDDVISSVEESLEKLRTDYVDLLLIHWPPQDVPLKETLGAMIQLREQRKTRLIGISNFTPELVEKAREIAPVACNQVEYHPFLSQKELIEQAKSHGMMLTAYSPLARGDVLENDTIESIADAHGKSPAQVGIRWLLQQNPVVAIPKASSSDHRKANFDVFDFELTDDEMQKIHGLAEGRRLIDPDWAPDW